MGLPAPYPLLVVGLDGGTFDVLDPLWQAGDLPHLRRLAQQGVRAELHSTMPPATLPAWTTFLTAANPGAHGVTDILTHPPGSYGLRPCHGAMRRLPTFLQRLSDKGFRVASLGVPGTFPPDPINGLCIAGFDAPGAGRAGPVSVYPRGAWPEVERLGGWQYATFNEHRSSADRLARAIAALHLDLAAKEKVILSLYQREPWDLFFVHLQAADTAGHHLWHTYDRSSPRARSDLPDALPSIYRRIDTLVGRLLDCLPKGGRTLVVSDHGMGGASDRAVYLNSWLAQQGLLRFRRSSRVQVRVGKALANVMGCLPPQTVGAALRKSPARIRERLMRLLRGQPVDFRHSTAFSDELDYAPSIWINRRGRFEHGMIEDDRRARRQIVTGLLALRDPDNGHGLVAAVHQREEVMHGPALDWAPDLIIEPAWSSGHRPSFLRSPGPGPAVRIMSPRDFSAPKGAGLAGVHRREGIFLATGPGLPARQGQPLAIGQAGALVYGLMGLEIPEDLEARPPEDWQTTSESGESRQANSESGESRQANDLPGCGTDAYTPEEALQVTNRLRAMGYLE